VKRLKKGPELKMPELKVPPALADLFYDLHDRRLLPFVALLVVAIVAVPFLLANSGSSSPAPAPAAASSAPATAGRTARFTVTQVDPGLRVPRKRLAKRHAKDPFEQKFTQPPVSAGSPTAESATAGTAVTETSVSTAPEAASGPAAVVVPVESSPPPSSTPGTDGGGVGGGDAGANPVTYTWAIDVKITKTTTKPDGSKEKSDPETRKGILPPLALPAKKTQVVAYIGVNPTTEKPLFLVSTEVTSVFGEAKCVAGTTTCQLLEMEPTFPETFSLGEGDVNYKINVLSVIPVPVPKPAPAAK
jgi:hypothetical protein